MRIVFARIIVLSFIALVGCTNSPTSSVVQPRLVGNPKLIAQIPLWQIERFPKEPAPWGQMDWAQRARDFDNYAFKDNNNPWTLRWDDTHYNMNSQTFAMPAYVGDTRAIVNGTQEAIIPIPATLSATLIGIDKTKFPLSGTNQVDYVSRLETFYHKVAPFKSVYDSPHPDLAISHNNTSWWYDHHSLPFVYALATRYPSIPWLQTATRTVADDQYEMLQSIGSSNPDFNHTAFNHTTNTLVDSSDGRKERDAGLVTALVEYWAYQKFGDAKYLDGAKWAMNYYQNATINPYYEWQILLGPYVAARLNAEQGTNYDVTKIMDWLLQSSSSGHAGWGTIQDQWSGYDVWGVQGSSTDGGGYGFAMNTFLTAWLAPMVKYDHRFARSVGRFLLNVSNAGRFFYPDQMNQLNQYHGSTYINTPAKVVPYEGLRKLEDGQSPRATGDPHRYGAQWGLDPNTKDLGLYGGAHAGLFGAIFKGTNVSKIWQIDLNALDFYSVNAYPTYLYYNPFSSSQNVTIPVSGTVDLFNPITGAFITRNVSGSPSISLPADEAVMVVVTPANGTISYAGNRTLINNVSVAYQPPNPNSSNLAYAASAVASSVQTNSGNPARAVVDGDTRTRWESTVSDPQWLRLDLGQSLSFARVTLRWEAAYAKGFQVQVSSDDANWTTVYSTTTGAGGVNSVTFGAVNKRFVRVLCQQRGTPYAYSMYDFEVYAN